MGKAHSHAWRSVRAFFPDVPPVRQAVLVGRDPDGVAAAAAAYGWEDAATDWRAVLERDDVDLVDVCLPGHLHAEVATAALEAGKHVLCEKPLANDLAEAEAMVATARATRGRGVRSAVGFNYRRVPALALARELIASGRIGRVREVRAAYLQDWLADASAPMTWRLRRETAGSGALLPEPVVMHPGPMNRGLEITAEAADDPRSRIIEQVGNGVSVRMAALYLLLADEGNQL